MSKIKHQKSPRIKKIPLHDFFRVAKKTTYRISPDGKCISYLASYKNRLNIFIQPVNSNRAKRITNVLSKDINIYYWGNNNTLLYLMDDNGDENFHLFSISKDGKNLKDLTPFENVRTEIIDELKNAESEFLIGLNKRNPEIFDVFRVNIESGKVELAAENPGNISKWIADHEGKIRAAITTDGLNSSLLYRENEQKFFHVVLNFDYKDSFIPLFFTFDNNNLYVSSNLCRDKNVIVLFDLQKGKEMKIIYEHPEVDVYDLYYSPKRKVLNYIGYTDWKLQNKTIDNKTSTIFNFLNDKFKNYQINIVSHNKNEDKFIICISNSQNPGSYYLYKKSNNSLKKLSDVKPLLKEKYFPESKPVSFVSRDGLKINGYLTIPKNIKPNHLPVLMRVHGGPWTRDDWYFESETQFFVNRGYAVFNINYRGSTGYGRKFLEASFKQWGKTMQNDITDGANWLISKGIANPKRLAIFGSSYGGYAVLAGLAFTPNLYKCGIDFYGLSNIFTFYKSIPAYWNQYLETLYATIGHPEKDYELLKEISPIFHVDKIKSPLLVIQGRRDARVNINESNQIVKELKQRCIKVKYIIKDDEGHGFWKQENLYHIFKEGEKFLKKYL